MLLGRRIQNFRKLALLGLPQKNIHDMNTFKSKKWENGENKKKKIEKPRIWVLWNVIRHMYIFRKLVLLEIPTNREEL